MPSATRPIRVLHLEDSARDADLIRHELEGAGLRCTIDVASSRDSFDAALARGSFDLILCNYNVPACAGVSALKRAKAAHPDVPVIIISDTVGEEEAVNCLHAGATDYLLKRRLERLAPAVRRAIQEAEERRSRARAEDALLERERRLSSIFEAVTDMLFYIAVESGHRYRVLSVNPAFSAVTGMADEQVIGRYVDEVLPAPQLALDQFARAIRERRAVRWEETSAFPHGPLTGEVSVSPIFDAAGACTHLVGAIRDITERRQLEAQLRQAQKMENVGQLASGIAHDFNNLLTVINGMAELVLDQVGGGDQQLRSDLSEIRRAGERAATLTRQLLAFSRKQILQPTVINLNALVAEMGTMLQRLLGEDVDLVITSSASRASVRADRGHIEQVIANLVVNARDAMPYGGTLIIDTSATLLDEATARRNGATVSPGSYVALQVRDTGSGMDEVTRRRIFEPFFTTKGPGKGTGLGLSTAYDIVRQSDGFITVESEPGRGSAFTIYLPQIVEAETRTDIVTPTVPVRGHETILVVEDMSGLRRLISRTLESAGYKVLTAASGEEALRLLEQHRDPVHLMVTDVVMPGMSGHSLVERINQVRPHMRVLYMSGYTDDVILRHGVPDAGVPFLNKPFRGEDLIRTIRQTLDAPAHSR